MSDEKKEVCDCGNPDCEGWEDGVEDLFDRSFESIAQMAKKDGPPIALLVFALSEKGNVVIESAGSAPGALTDMILSETCLQVSDYLENRALNTPGYKELVAQIEAANKPSQD